MLRRIIGVTLEQTDGAVAGRFDGRAEVSLGPADNSPTNATSRSSCRALRTDRPPLDIRGARARPRRSSVLAPFRPARRSIDAATLVRRAHLKARRRGRLRRSVPVRRSDHSLLNVHYGRRTADAVPVGIAPKKAGSVARVSRDT